MRSRWSIRVGRLLGIDVYVHATFFALLTWTAFAGYVQTRTVGAALAGVAFTIAVFGIVVLHELGHAVTARRFGVRTRDITLWPFGGIARLERMPDEPRHELLVALAGPAVNVVLAGVLYAVLRIAGADLTPTLDVFSGVSFWARLMWVNVMIAGFNLLPAFPLDGGRAVRALLAMRLDYVHATRIAAKLGQGLALVMGMIGLAINLMLVVVAFFVWIAAAAEAAAVEAKAIFERIPVRNAMLTRFAVLGPDDTLSDAAAQLLAGSDVDLPVVDHGQLVGVLPRSELVRGLTQLGERAPVRSVMRTRFATAEPTEMLDRALSRAEISECRVVPVLHQGALVGLLTPENVAEMLMLEQALRPVRRSALA